MHMTINIDTNSRWLCLNDQINNRKRLRDISIWTFQRFNVMMKYKYFLSLVHKAVYLISQKRLCINDLPKCANVVTSRSKTLTIIFTINLHLLVVNRQVSAKLSLAWCSGQEYHLHKLVKRVLFLATLAIH